MPDRESSKSETALFSTLHERAKELSCLYKVEEILSNFNLSLDEVFRRVIKVIPPGWQLPDSCQAQIQTSGKIDCDRDGIGEYGTFLGIGILREEKAESK